MLLRTLAAGKGDVHGGMGRIIVHALAVSPRKLMLVLWGYCIVPHLRLAGFVRARGFSSDRCWQ